MPPPTDEYRLTLDDDGFTLTLADQGVAVPATHAASHASAGADPLTLANTQITGLGTMSTQNANSVTITGGAISGITDLPVADGGTGASTAANARTNLGLGSIATQGAGAVAITGGTISGVTSVGTAGITDYLGDALTLEGTASALVVAAGTLTVSGVASIAGLVLTNDLSVANGGTGVSTLTGVVTGSGTSALTAATSSTVGHVLTCTGANTFAFSAPTTPSLVSGTGVLNGTAGVVVSITGVTTGSKIVATQRNAAVGTQGLLRVDHGTNEITVFSTQATDLSDFTYFGVL